MNKLDWNKILDDELLTLMKSDKCDAITKVSDVTNIEIDVYGGITKEGVSPDKLYGILSMAKSLELTVDVTLTLLVSSKPHIKFSINLEVGYSEEGKESYWEIHDYGFHTKNKNIGDKLKDEILYHDVPNNEIIERYFLRSQLSKFVDS